MCRFFQVGLFIHTLNLKAKFGYKIPVAMSLVATYVSGVTLLGTSTEIYVYGIQYAYILAGPMIMGLFFHFIVVPVFYDLNFVSMFEVAEKNFISQGHI